MTAIRYAPFVAPPRVLTEAEARPSRVIRLTLAELCRIAEIPLRVTSPHLPGVILHAGGSHFWSPEGFYVGTKGRFDRSREAALRVLEVLAHGFHDYAARECLCGRGLFSPPSRRGRPSLAGRPMTPAERMRRRRRTRVRAERR